MLKYNKIICPESGLLINVKSNLGKQILYNYINELSGGAGAMKSRAKRAANRVKAANRFKIQKWPKKKIGFPPLHS